MLENSSEELKTLVLLEFTRRLIIGASPTVFLKKIERPIRKTEKEKFREIVKSKIPGLVEEAKPETLKELAIVKPRVLAKPLAPRAALRQKAEPLAGLSKSQTKPILRVPETRLPPQFAYLRPTATTQVELDLEKLNPLLADSGVNVIESNGPDQQVIVRGRMGTKPTDIILTREEIDKIIRTFSEKSKIPIGEGATKIVLGRFMLSAIISEEAGSRFIIKKMPPTPPTGPGLMPRR